MHSQVVFCIATFLLQKQSTDLTISGNNPTKTQVSSLYMQAYLGIYRSEAIISYFFLICSTFSGLKCGSTKPSFLHFSSYDMLVVWSVIILFFFWEILCPTTFSFPFVFSLIKLFWLHGDKHSMEMSCLFDTFLGLSFTQTINCCYQCLINNSDLKVKACLYLFENRFSETYFMFMELFA